MSTASETLPRSLHVLPSIERDVTRDDAVEGLAEQMLARIRKGQRRADERHVQRRGAVHGKRRD